MIISVPATSANLGSGFDTLGLALELRNFTKILPATRFSISINEEGSNNSKLQNNNMFVNIFYKYYEDLVGKKNNFQFIFNNYIPLTRGLGSSAAVVVSAITAAYEMANIEISKQQLLILASKYEPCPDNITAAIMGGFNVALVEEDRIYSQKKVIPNYLKSVVIIPNKRMSTKFSRTFLPSSYSKESALYNLSHSSLMVGAFFNENWELLRIASRDKLHEQKRMEFLPELFEIQKISIENGALMSTLSGSGSSFFNMIFAEDAKAFARIFEKKYIKFAVRILDFDNDGVVVSDK